MTSLKRCESSLFDCASLSGDDEAILEDSSVSSAYSSRELSALYRTISSIGNL